jgi:hypothetical protein
MFVSALTVQAYMYKKAKKGKTISLTGPGGPYGCETSRLPHLLEYRFTHGGKFVSLTRRLAALYPPPPKKILVLISVTDWVDPRAIVRLEGLGQLKKNSDPIRNRTRDLSTCSIMPQPTTLPRATSIHVAMIIITKYLKYLYGLSLVRVSQIVNICYIKSLIFTSLTMI